MAKNTIQDTRITELLIADSRTTECQHAESSLMAASRTPYTLYGKQHQVPFVQA